MPALWPTGGGETSFPFRYLGRGRGGWEATGHRVRTGHLTDPLKPEAGGLRKGSLCLRR